jgi:hypothetical protein
MRSSAGQRVQASDRIIEPTTTADVESRALWGRHGETLEFLNLSAQLVSIERSRGERFGSDERL